MIQWAAELDSGEIVTSICCSAEALWNWDLEPDMAYRCRACLWESFGTSDSDRFRAERHAEETGHEVRLLAERSEPDGLSWTIEETL